MNFELAEEQRAFQDAVLGIAERPLSRFLLMIT